jgi:hypothetical protein
MILAKEVISDFFEQFECFSNVICFSDKPFQIKCGPKRLIDLHQRKEMEFVLSPVYNQYTKMCWIDVDSHSGTSEEQQESLILCNKIYDELIKLKATPEVSESQTATFSYHIVLWFEKPQNKRFVYNVLNGFVKSLGITLPRVEIGPQNGKLFRPWFMPCAFKSKQVGRLITRGARMTDISFLKSFYVPPESRTNRNSNSSLPLTALDLTKFIPNGMTLKRNQAMLLLVNECKRRGLDDNQILEHSKTMYLNAGKAVHDPIEVHLSETARAIQNYKSSGIKSWDLFWQMVVPNLEPMELLKEVHRYAQANKFLDLIIPVRRIATYYNVSLRTAWRKIQSLITNGVLTLKEKGSYKKRIANRYELGPKF